MATPLCPYFNNCGGCSFQHVDYEEQVENKKTNLAKAINYQDITVFSGNSYHYRNRMDFVFGPNGLGLRKRRNWKEIVDINKCVISNDAFNILLTEVRNFFKETDYFDIRKKSGTFRYAVIRTPPNDSSISFVLNEDSTKLKDAIDKIKEFAEISTAKNIVVTYVPSKTDNSISKEYFVVKGNDYLKTTICGKDFSFPLQGFFQNNPELIEKMQQYVKDLLTAHDRTYTHLLDLYGGVGTFGIINAELFKTVTIIEGEEEAIKYAQQNITNNKITNTNAMVLNDKQLKKVTLSTPLFVITDPPRSGMNPKTIDRLRELKPKVMIYISCNIEQLGKDLIKFNDYQIKSAALFDLFPQTPHTEAVIELVLK